MPNKNITLLSFTLLAVVAVGGLWAYNFVQGESTTRLTGTATTVVNRGDYNLTIPSVPNVANVGEDVTLEIDFVAEAASS